MKNKSSPVGLAALSDEALEKFCAACGQVLPYCKCAWETEMLRRSPVQEKVKGPLI